jgi:hypothetical protein
MLRLSVSSSLRLFVSSVIFHRQLIDSSLPLGVRSLGAIEDHAMLIAFAHLVLKVLA